MGPIDYTTAVANPIAMALQGYQAGAGIRQDRQEQEYLVQQRQMQQQMFEQQKARAEQVQTYMGDFAELVKTRQLTADDVSSALILMPEVADQVKGVWEVMSEAKKQGTITDMSRLAMAYSRAPEVANGILDEMIVAAENSGDTERVAGLKAMRQQADIDPDVPVSMAMLSLASVMPKDQFGNFMSVLMPGNTQTEAFQTLSLRAAAAGLQPGTPEYQEFMKQGGAERTPLVVNNLGDTLSPGLTKRDELFAQVAVDWEAGGGVDSIKQTTQLADTLEALERGDKLTGPVTGQLPDFVLAFTNPESINAREAVEEVVQRNLRLILGAQFAQREGEQLIRRAYNPKLKPEQNAKRVARLLRQMEIAADQRQEMVDYFNANDTLKGYNGKRPSMADFEAAIDGPEPSKRGSGGVPTVKTDADYDALPSGTEFIDAEDGKRYRKP
jgi:hypothetical protein